MIYHVLPGDSLVEEFAKTGLEGNVIVCREVLIDGPIDADALHEFWEQRARFIVAAHGSDEIEYHEKVAGELIRLTELESDDEVNLWFEYELLCSVNMWFCLALLSETEATVYRVEPIGLEEAKRWDGFAFFDADDLRACAELRTRLTVADIELGTNLWNAYRRRDHIALRELSKTESEGFPFLSEVVAAAIDQDIEPLEVVRSITAAGETDFAKIFAEFKKRAGVYGYGDVQVQRLLDS